MDDSCTSSEVDGACTENCVQNSVNMSMESYQNRQVKKTIIYCNPEVMFLRTNIAVVMIM